VLRLFDTALGRVAPLEPRSPGQVSMYVCGPTVYDVPHLGHGRFSLVFDVLRRYLEWCGLDVVYVSNVTDVDDNIINRAHDEGRTPEEVVAEYEAVWWDAMARLGVKPPTHDPHATAYVDDMVALIGRLIDAGVAYEISDGVYFESEKVEGYGLLARQPIDSLRSGARVDVVDEKRSPVDFALWKKAKPGEPSWPSPWGEGRPGWHTECVVMSLDLLGDDFDIHGGGQDLAFPHHENERVQAVALGRSFARRWVHNGWVVVEGEKMSKSLHNFTTLTDLLDRTDARAYRLLVLQSHYRSPVEVTPDTVTRAERTLRGLDEFARRVAAAGLPDTAADPAALAAFREHMDDDLQTPAAMAVVFDAVNAGNKALDAGDLPGAAGQWAAVRELSAAVGLTLVDASADETLDPATADLVARRDAARAGRDWATADALRAELEAGGWTVKDTPSGTQVHR
jgi:cysteinyl-tRNA synthetase